jgi:dihydrofolate synthase/folylpolyglutamate synthase
MIASILTSAGYRTGLYTSPHLVRFNERIRVDGKEIADDELARLTNLVRPHVRRMKGTFFEATTAIAFRHFAEKAVDIAVIETGLGGRWDATNIVTPLLTIITSIDFDHMEYLGNTLRSIAGEKGGIIKRKIPCITGVEDRGALAVLARIAGENRAPLIRAGEKAALEIVDSNVGGITVNLATKRRAYRNLFAALGGSHQGMNLRLALLAVESLATTFRSIGEAEIRAGLRSISENTGFRGRLDVLARSPLIIADVGHNSGALRTLAAEFGAIIGRKIVAVFGVMKDKEYRSMAADLGRLARLVVAVEPETPRALSSRTLMREFHAIGVPALDGKSVAAGVRAALLERREDEPLLVIGSHYTVGEAIPALKKMVRGVNFR